VHSEGAHWDGISMAKTYILGINAEALNGQLADDVRRMQRAWEIHTGRIRLEGMTLDNLQANVHGMMGDLSNFTIATEAREITGRIIAAVPSLAEAIAAVPPVTAF
jgi:hypothetical protein